MGLDGEEYTWKKTLNHKVYPLIHRVQLCNRVPLWQHDVDVPLHLENCRRGGIRLVVVDIDGPLKHDRRLPRLPESRGEADFEPFLGAFGRVDVLFEVRGEIFGVFVCALILDVKGLRVRVLLGIFVVPGDRANVVCLRV